MIRSLVLCLFFALCWNSLVSFAQTFYLSVSLFLSVFCVCMMLCTNITTGEKKKRISRPNKWIVFIFCFATPKTYFSRLFHCANVTYFASSVFVSARLCCNDRKSKKKSADVLFSSLFWCTFCIVFYSMFDWIFGVSIISSTSKQPAFSFSITDTCKPLQLCALFRL